MKTARYDVESIKLPTFVSIDLQKSLLRFMRNLNRIVDKGQLNKSKHFRVSLKQ
jgi:hypothetical protein